MTRTGFRPDEGTSVVGGDLLRPETLGPALVLIDCALYLAHSMDIAGNFEEEERSAARNFAKAAQAAGLRRIVYLGALAQEEGEKASDHIASRHEVGEILRSSGAEVVEFRASAVIGAGSLPFEVVRALVEKLPFLVTPKWVGYRLQPIAASDLVGYILAALQCRLGKSAVYEIGGADVVTYRQLMLAYARARGLHRAMLPVPVITPRLSGLWLNLIAPAQARIGRRIVDSVRHGSFVKDHAATRDFKVQPMGVSDAISEALRDEVSRDTPHPVG